MLKICGINFQNKKSTESLNTNFCYVTGFGGEASRANDGNTDALFTGAVDDSDDQSEEYLALWGYRQLAPNGSGEYLDTPWITPDTLRLIRIRMTLHDSQLRLDGGRTYEFVFPVNPRQ